MKKRCLPIIILLALGLSLGLCACGDTAPAPTPSPQGESTQPPLPTPTPAPKKFVLNGKTYATDVKIVDLRGLRSEAVEETAEALRYFTELETIKLGDHAQTPLPVALLTKLHEACPQAVMQYSFKIYGRQVELSASKLDLSYVQIRDGGRLVRAVMDMMRDLRYADMDSCGLNNGIMAKLRDDYPEVKIVWRIWFGEKYSVRTDVERILASSPDIAGELIHDNVMPLMYCTEVKYLDLGHNNYMDTIEFVRYMPKLEVGIFAMSQVEDFSPLASCPELEYLELQTACLHDLTPLSGLTKLRHLNICYSFALNDITPLYSLTGLERLWIGFYDPVPPEQIETMQRLAPDCVINTTTKDPTEEGWRSGEPDYPGWPKYDDRYALLREQFKYQEGAYSYYYLDPNYSYGH